MWPVWVWVLAWVWAGAGASQSGEAAGGGGGVGAGAGAGAGAAGGGAGGSGGVGVAGEQYEPRGPLVMCSFLPLEFLMCDEPVDHKGNKTAREEAGHGCVRWGGSRYDDVERTKVHCTALPDIECFGSRTFLRDGFPCVKYSSHYFTTTLIYSILLGFLGMDRFCLGQTGTAVGKLLSLGGLGIWWILDICLLITNGLHPEDDSNWNPYV